MDGQEKLLDYIRLILAGKSHEHIAIRKMLTFLVEIRAINETAEVNNV